MVVDVQKAVKVEVSLLGTIALRCVVATCCVVPDGGIGVRSSALFRRPTKSSEQPCSVSGLTSNHKRETRGITSYRTFPNTKFRIQYDKYYCISTNRRKTGKQEDVKSSTLKTVCAESKYRYR
jgi:hypothetical protein